MINNCEGVYIEGAPYPTYFFGLLIAYLSGLPNYANDTEARAAGLETNDHYFFSVETDTGITDILKRVSPL